jgi:hypothetical protein
MAEKAIQIAGALKKYATDIGDDVLFDAVNWTLSDLLGASDTVVKERCTIIYNLANTHSAAIAAEGITAVIIGDLNTLIVAYDAILGTPSEARANKKEATANLKTYVKQTDSILKKKIDLLMLQFKDSNSSFYDKYVISREIIDLGTQHTRASGTVTDTEGNEVAGATVSVVGTDLVKTTDSEGVYLFKPFIPGDFSFSIAKQGFVTKLIENVHVSPGQHLVLDVVLEREVFTGSVNGGQVVTIFGSGNPQWMPGATVKLKNTSNSSEALPLHFYGANNAGEGWGGQGEAVYAGQEVIHTVSAAEFKPYLNVYNQGAGVQTFEVTVL